MIRAAASLLGVVGLGALACVSPTDPLGRNDALQTAQKSYTESVRWGDLEEASRYVAPELRGDFLALADRFGQIRITDFEYGAVSSQDHETAEVEVTYRAYVMPYFVERQIRERQRWYRESGLDNVWRVRPQLSLLLEMLESSRP